MAGDRQQDDPELQAITETSGLSPGAPGEARGQSSAPAGLPVPGQPWGKYLIEKTLGAGGQASVFQAYDQFGAAGHTALKVPHGSVPAERLRGWAGTEAEPLVKLDHPNIVRVVDAGCVGNVPYVATELIDGLPLNARVKVGPVPTRQVLAWMIQLCDAVA
ncbi:MAG: protein kinase family protein, partial [Planctomycetota bacterium]